MDFFKANGEIDIDKRTETTKVMGASYDYDKNMQQKLSSLGSILSLGIEYHKKGNVDWSVDYGISQIIPFYIDYKKSNASKKSNGNNKSSDNNISSQIFRNGFATRLGMNVIFLYMGRFILLTFTFLLTALNKFFTIKFNLTYYQDMEQSNEAYLQVPSFRPPWTLDTHPTARRRLVMGRNFERLHLFKRLLFDSKCDRLE